jgi:hypothetical protein
MRKILFMASMGAKRCKNGILTEFQKKLTEATKKTSVIIMALARKIITVENARTRDFYERAERALT